MPVFTKCKIEMLGLWGKWDRLEAGKAHRPSTELPGQGTAWLLLLSPAHGRSHLPPVPRSLGRREGALSGCLHGQTRETEYWVDKNSTNSSSAPSLELRQRSPAWFPMETSRRGPRAPACACRGQFRMVPVHMDALASSMDRAEAAVSLGGDGSRICPSPWMLLSRNSRSPHPWLRKQGLLAGCWDARTPANRSRKRPPTAGTLLGVPLLPQGQPGASPRKMPPAEPVPLSAAKMLGGEGSTAADGCHLNHAEAGIFSLDPFLIIS